MGLKECQVTLSIRPGDSDFEVVRVETTGRVPVGLSDVEGLTDLRLDVIARTLPASVPLMEIARWGHFTGLEPL